MKIFITTSLLFLLLFSARSQSIYFPPINGNDWAVTEPESLGWCAEKVDSLINFLDEKNSKSFILLKDGKIVIEHYFDNFTQDSNWYFASASKTVAAFLTGMAQQDGDLNINDPVSDYIGEGWTQAPPDKEALITLWHQLTMTMGLDDTYDDPVNCQADSCFQYFADAGTRWAYHTSAYRKLQDVLEVATGVNKNIYTFQQLTNRIGMKGFWLDYVRYGTARDMARFGLLMLGNGVWNTDSLMTDQAYMKAMIQPSQALNPSYGYLTWLNGQTSYLLPGLQFSFPGPLVPAAPADLYAALGKNDQKIYVVPGMGLVVIRQGESVGDPVAGPSSFDNELWEKIMNLECESTAVSGADAGLSIQLSPNPADGYIDIKINKQEEDILKLKLFNPAGQVFLEMSPAVQQDHIRINLQDLPPGVYLIQLRSVAGLRIFKFFKS